MDIAIPVLTALIVAVIGYLAAVDAARRQIRALEKTTSEQIAHLKHEIGLVVRQIDISSVGMTSAELTAIDEILIQYPLFRPYFYDGVEPEESMMLEDKQRVKAIAARLVNGYATILLQSRSSPGSMQFDTAWVNATIARRYGNSPPCCEHLMSYIEEYAVTGQHQFKLMLKGLNDAVESAKFQNQDKKVESLTTRIAVAELAQERLFNKLNTIRERDITV